MSRSNPETYPFGKRSTLWAFSLFFVLMIFDFADRMIIASLLPLLKEEWSITDTQAGLLNSALIVGMIIFSLPVSIVIDRWSRVKTASIIGVTWSLASAAGGLAQNIAQFSLTRAAVGSAQAGYSPAAAAWMMTAFPRRRIQLALGAFSAGQPIGMAIGVALGGYIASQYGWRAALGIMAAPGLVAAVLLYRARDYPSVAPEDSAGQSAFSARGMVDGLRTGLGEVLSSRALRAVYLSSGMVTLLISSVIYFLPSYLIASHGLSIKDASYLASGVLMVGVIGAPLGGWLIDLWCTRYFEAKIAYPLLCTILATALLGVAFMRTHGLALQYGLILVAFFLLTSGSSGPFAVSQELVHPGRRALSMTCNALASHLLGSAPGAVITGVLSDRTNLGFALFCVTLISGLLTAASLAYAQSKYRSEYEAKTNYGGTGPAACSGRSVA